MSDMYVQLRARIPIVAEQTHLGTQRLQDAQDAVGLSNEAIARKVHISEKTWRRWKTAGKIPTASLPAVAAVLRLEISPDDELAELHSALAEVRQGLEEIHDVKSAVARIEALLLERAKSPRSAQG